MKKLSEINWTALTIVGVVVALLVAFIYYRGHDFKDCVMAKYDLKRETNFRILTGACTTEGKDGGQVYINQLRGFGSDDQDSHD
ncbi:hypothetical protein PQC38_gp036 [Aeromonas phage BUCT695]|uniref:hypothetical protein n=1 Tax=Aeromonas phage BUCT695 TaxID=2908630 RepID=UPI0023299722|nr:hypothetical protein PQC38_gp036 [Aeromonas phage BUCT695]UIW10512.1 hypothetical protein [Aeromonas phage BUCT695]